MTLQEFSDNFDTLISSYMRFKDFDKKEQLDSIDFDEYEKSIFLTKAQEVIVESLYSGNNIYQEGFEQTEKLKRYLSILVKDIKLDKYLDKDVPVGMESFSKFFRLPSDLLYITQENLNIKTSDCYNNTNIMVTPVKQDYYQKQVNNPFRGLNTTRALRLDIGDNIVEIVCTNDINYYYVRYISKPSPIILVNLPNDLYINGINTATECKLNVFLHKNILEEAVKLALQSRGYYTDKNDK